MTPLFVAAFKGMVECVRVMLETNSLDEKGRMTSEDEDDRENEGQSTNQNQAPPNVNSCNYLGFTPLMVAAPKHPQVVRLLLSSCDDLQVNAQNGKDGGTALHLALLNGQDASAEALMEDSRTDCTLLDSLGCSPLYIACKSCPKSVDSLLGKLSAVAVDLGRDLHVPLLYAAMQGDALLAKRLLKAGANPARVRDDLGRTALHHAAFYGSLEVAELLFSIEIPAESRLNPDVRDSEGATPLLLASYNGHTQIARFLVQEMHADVNAVDAKHLHPLFVSAQRSHLECVDFLLSCAGIDVDARIDSGATALFTAVSASHNPDIVRALLDAGANPNARFPAEMTNCTTCLHMAAVLDSPDILEMLLTVAPGIEANVPSRDQALTPLDMAILKDRRDNVRVMLQHKQVVDFDRENATGNTPLHLACLIGSAEIVGMLVEAGARLNLPNNAGQTPLHVAVTKGHQRVVEVLCRVKKGVDLQAKDSQGRTPLQLAQLCKHEDIVRTLRFGSKKTSINDASSRGGCCTIM